MGEEGGRVSPDESNFVKVSHGQAMATKAPTEKQYHGRTVLTILRFDSLYLGLFYSPSHISRQAKL